MRSAVLTVLLLLIGRRSFALPGNAHHSPSVPARTSSGVSRASLILTSGKPARDIGVPWPGRRSFNRRQRSHRRGDLEGDAAAVKVPAGFFVPLRSVEGDVSDRQDVRSFDTLADGFQRPPGGCSPRPGHHASGVSALGADSRRAAFRIPGSRALQYRGARSSTARAPRGMVARDAPPPDPASTQPALVGSGHAGEHFAQRRDHLADLGLGTDERRRHREGIAGEAQQQA